MNPLHAYSCPECGAGYGDTHWPGCAYAPRRRSPRDPDIGRREAIAVNECRRRGWAVVHVPGEGLRPCRPDEPGAYTDLNRYAYWLANGDADIDGNEPGTSTLTP
jgi:hypothetical protein